jgi:hypothetical protein
MSRPWVTRLARTHQRAQILVMRPGDHPEFFRFPAPEGQSRESSIRLDGEGRFWHDGELVEHAGLALALARWISRHPDDGRFILTNGYDWTYFTLDDVPYFVRGVSSGAAPELMLSDGSTEPFPDAGYRIGRGGALYCPVKHGGFEARFTPSAQAALTELIDEGAAFPVLRVGDRRIRLPS